MLFASVVISAMILHKKGYCKPPGPAISSIFHVLPGLRPRAVVNLSLQLRHDENIVDRPHGVLEILVGDADDDVELAGSLVDHADIDLGMG